MTAAAARAQRMGALAPRRDDLIRDHIPLVRRIAWHVHGRMSAALDVEELIQTGLVALVEAADAYEDRGHAFATYASMRIKGAMIDALRRIAGSPRSASGNRRAIEAARQTVEHRARRPASPAEIASEMGMPLATYRRMEADVQSVSHVAIDDVYSDHDPRFADGGGDAHDWLDRQDSLEAVAEAIDTLNDKEKLVLQLYFHEEMNLAEIGRVLNVTPGRVCQIKASALAAVKRAVERDDQ